MKTETKNTLLASSANLEAIIAVINKYFFSNSIYLQLSEKEENTWDVYNAKGICSNFCVKLKKGRYRFEQK